MSVRTNEQFTFLDRRAWDVALAATGIRTNAALAARVGISRSRVYQIRAGYVPPLGVRQRLARSLGVQPSRLWRTVPPELPRDPEAAEAAADLPTTPGTVRR